MLEELEFICPISFEVMSDPVIAPSGHSFERSAIERWFQQHPRPTTNPMTQEPMDANQLIPNRGLKAAIELWQRTTQEWRQKVQRLKVELKKKNDNSQLSAAYGKVRFFKSRPLYALRRQVRLRCCSFLS
jgi:hypothetical protein